MHSRCKRSVIAAPRRRKHDIILCCTIDLRSLCTCMHALDDSVGMNRWFTPPYPNTQPHLTPGSVSCSTKLQHIIFKWLQSVQGTRHKWVPTGVFEPVDEELHTHDVRVVQGVVPRCINGMYIRTRPNPQFQPNGGYCGCAFRCVFDRTRSYSLRKI